MKPEHVPPLIAELAAAVDGTVEECASLPDGSGFAVMSYPLPDGHWLTKPHDNIPPMPLRAGTDHPFHATWCREVTAAARYAVRASTMNGRESDFDPDAMVQNFVVGLLGYHTPDGLSSEAMFNPAPVPPLAERAK